MASPPDRIAALLENDHRLTGLDFVQVIAPPDVPPGQECGPFILRIYFLTDIRQLLTGFYDPDPPLPGGPPPPETVVPLTPESIVIRDASGDPLVPNVPVIEEPAFNYDFDEDSCRSFLDVPVIAPHDFRNYRLSINDPNAADETPSRIDPFLNEVVFSFQVGCEDELDCKPAPLQCPEEPRVDFPVDYLARDFVSLRNALLDYAAHRYPQWTMPIEADVGTMLLEIFAALGDEFSYIQDRHAREAFLETATERRSLRKKARLLDYDIHDGRSATTLLEFRVADSAVDAVIIPRGTKVKALTEGGPPVTFEVGLGFRDEKTYSVRKEWNAGSDFFKPYCIDPARQCLEIGATEVLIENGEGEAEIVDFEALQTAVADGDVLMLLKTDPSEPGLPRRRHIVHLVEVSSVNDPLFNKVLTRLRWDESDALPFQIDQALLELTLNVIPAVAGERRGRVDVGVDPEVPRIEFVCGPDETTDPALPVAVEREGSLPLQLDPEVTPRRPPIFLFGLPETDTNGLAFLGSSLRETLPEIRLIDKETDQPWTYVRSLLEAGPDSRVFTLEDGIWRRIVSYVHRGEEIVHQDYATGQGYTLRFGDGEFGRLPGRGTTFQLEYRLGPGVFANVAADTINKLDVESSSPLLTQIKAVSNPWPVLDGADPESASDIKQLVPEAYRAEFFFAVRPEDYGTQAERLPFVQRAHGKRRWTGSWNTMFVSADPFGSFTLNDQQFFELEDWMNCVRQAGRDVIVQDPKSRTLDLEIHLCVQPFAYPGQVVQAVSEALLGRGGVRPLKGFFHPDNFTFGMPLRRSALEAVIQDVPGVLSVQRINKRERGRTFFQTMTELTVTVAPDEVFRLENDPTHPERGSLRIVTTGGA